MASDDQKVLLAVAITLLAVSWIMVAARIWARAGLIHKFGHDDRAMIVAQMLFTAHIACLILAIRYGLGRPLKALEAWEVRKALLFFFFDLLLYNFATVVVKIALCLQLLRIAAEPLHINMLRFFMLNCVLVGLGASFLLIFTCLPVRAYWTPELIPESRCYGITLTEVLLGLCGASLVVGDLALTALPVLILKDLQMSCARKCSVVAILALGGVASIATVVRLAYMPSMFGPGPGFTTKYFLDGLTYTVCQELEVSAGIIAGSVATLTPLLKLVREKLGIEAKPSSCVRKLNTWHTPRVRRRSVQLESLSMPLESLSDGAGSKKEDRRLVRQSTQLQTASLEHLRPSVSGLEDENKSNLSHDITDR